MTKNELHDKKLLERGIKYTRIGNYTTQYEKIEYKCHGCGLVELKTPKGVLGGRGCKACFTKSLTKTSEQYDEEISESTYTRLEPYRCALTEILHKCKKCGSEHLVRPQSVINGHECRFCANRASKTTSSYIEELEGRSIEVLSEYVGNKALVLHKCTVCNHEWKARPNNVLSKDSGCPNCALAASTSRGEKELLEFIHSTYTGWIIENDRTILDGKELDIVLPDLGIAFEYNGVYWHNSDNVGKYYHINKTNSCFNNSGYTLIHVFEDMWENKKDILKSRIRSLFGITTKIYARNCEVREIAFPYDFLEENHLQGAGTTSSINLGLYYLDELVAVMTFSTPRFTKGYKYELIRFCSLLDITVVGGASKLLKYFKSTYPGNIISYSNKTWSNGNLYKQLGFTYLRTSEPNYRYYKGIKSLSRMSCQKYKLVEQGFDPNLTEEQIMKDRGYFKVYDAGNDVWGLE